MIGARPGKASKLRRLISAALARDLTAFLVPGPEIFRIHGLDVESAGLTVVASPRHASVLLVAGAISPALRDAVAVVYAQMMRPRALFSLDTGDLPPLPAADVKAGLSQQDLVRGVQRLRQIFAEDAFAPSVTEFDAPVLHVRIEYTCPMHPEVVQNEPGSCPKCGMNLVPREVQAGQHEIDIHADVPHGKGHDHGDHHEAVHREATHDAGIEYTCPMHPEIVQSEPGSCPKCGMFLEPRETPAEAGGEHHGHAHAPAHEHHDTGPTAVVEYTCPMHPEIVQSEPGSCPKCGMFLESRETPAEAADEHHGHAHSPAHEHHDTGPTAVVEYTCPMHPEIVQDEPGSCPKCGMFLEPRETPAEAADEHHGHAHSPAHEHHDTGHAAAVEYTCPMHPEIVQTEPGSCPKCGMFLEPREAQSEGTGEHHGHAHAPVHEHHDTGPTAVVEYTCPMHPEIVQSEPGSCPKCGMFLEPRESHAAEKHDQAHAGTESHAGHGGTEHDHDEMGFMSMIEVTKDLPRSGDGLPMEWIDAPFGPFFPGLPGGLLLTLTLDGDTVAGADIRALTDELDLPQAMDGKQLPDRLAGMDPLAPDAYRLLACRALEGAAGLAVPATVATARIGALERQRIVSHLGWLSLFAQQTGFDWLMRRAASLQSACLEMEAKHARALIPVMRKLAERLWQTPLLKSRTAGIGRVAADATLCGPVARAAGIPVDARSKDPICTSLGFTPVSHRGGDVLARLQVRLDEIGRSLALIDAAGVIASPKLADVGDASGSGEAVVETPRGPASLHLTLERGQMLAARLETPSTRHAALVERLTEQQALGDALLAVGSLDLSPWELRQ